MSKFKIQGVGLDTSTLDYDPGISLGDEGYGYIYTSIPSNNDYLLGTGIRSVKDGTPLIVYTNHLDGVKFLLEEHLEVIGRREADLLLIEGSCKSLDSFSEDLFRGVPAKHYGIQSPVSVEQLTDLIDNKGFKVEYIALTINPFEFNYEILQWAKQRGIYVIGLNPMGGYLSAPRNINAFSAPYLLSFCATYSDVVLVSGRNLVKAWEDKIYLEGLIGEESDARYDLKKTIIKPVKDVKQAIFTSVNLRDLDAIVPYHDPSLLLDKGWTEMALGTSRVKMPILGITNPEPETIDLIDGKGEEDEEKSRVERDVKHYLDIAYYPKDGDQGTVFTVARYKILEYLQSHYKASDGWRVSTLGKIGNSVLMVTITQEDTLKGWFIWQKVVQGGEHTFVLIVPNSDPKNIIFREISNKENSSEEEANPNI